jgi:hypothetical protein
MISMHGFHLSLSIRQNVVVVLIEHGAKLSNAFTTIEDFAHCFEDDVSWIDDTLLIEAYGAAAVRKYNRMRGMAGMF